MRVGVLENEGRLGWFDVFLPSRGVPENVELEDDVSIV